MGLRLLAAVVTIGMACSSASTAGADPAPPINPLRTLVDAAAARLQTAEPVAASKWVTGAQVEDTQRVVTVLDAVGADAAGRGVDQAYIRRVFTDQINATEAIEYTRFSQWKMDPAGAPNRAPDLSNSRAAIDDYNRTMVAEIAARQPVLHDPNCAAVLSDARGQVITERGLDPMYQAALSLSTRRYCQ